MFSSRTGKKVFHHKSRRVLEEKKKREEKLQCLPYYITSFISKILPEVAAVRSPRASALVDRRFHRYSIAGVRRLGSDGDACFVLRSGFAGTECEKIIMKMFGGL